MSDILCIYYSRTGHTRRAVKEIAEALGAEITAITDDCDRSGWRGYMRCGMDAMKTSTRPLQPFETEKPLGAYKLVIVGSPVWAGRCASPIRALLKRRGLEMENVAYVVTRSTTQRSEEVYDRWICTPGRPTGWRCRCGRTARGMSSGGTTLSRMCAACWRTAEDGPCRRS